MSEEEENFQSKHVDASVRVGKGARIRNSAVGQGASVSFRKVSPWVVGALMVAIVGGVIANAIWSWWPHALNVLMKGKP